MSRRAFTRPELLLVLLLMFLVLLTCMGFSALPEFVFYLALGWVVFLARVLPQVRVAWDGVATGIVCLALFAAGAHGFATWLYAEVRRAEGRPGPRWRPRWTAASVAVVVLMFVAGLATVGVVHQAGWLLRSRIVEFDGTRSAARRARSVHNLKQIGLALDNYRQSHETLPQGGTFDAWGGPQHSWATLILPMGDPGPLYNSVNLSVPWDDPRNTTAFQTRVHVYLNPGVRPEPTPDAAGYAPSHYAGNALVLGARAWRAIPDGASQTLMAGEVADGFRPWGDPTNWRDVGAGINRSPRGFGSPFPGGANFLFVDGTVRFLKDGTAPRVLKALSTPDGGEAISPDQY